MSYLVGKYKKKVDSKSRLLLPAEIRAIINTDPDPYLYIRVVPDLPLAIVFPPETYSQLQSKYRAFPIGNPYRLQFYALTVAHARTVDKDGRVNIPGFPTGAAVVVGNGDSFYVTTPKLQELLESNTEDLGAGDSIYSLEDTLFALLAKEEGSP